MTSGSSDSLLQFPCEFPIKVLGHGSVDLEARVVGIVRRHAPSLGEASVSSRPSRRGKYLAVTVTLRAESRKQLDAIYLDLIACPDVIMAL
jgi:putative lipoic acid-binding regulatory protein